MTMTMTRFIALLKLDARLALRHKLVHVTVAIASLFGLLIAFVFPAELVPPGDPVSLGLREPLAALLEAAPAPTVLVPDVDKPPFNQSLIPILFAVDLCVLGFMFGAVMILQDKEQSTVRYFRIGPGTSLEYIAAKLTVNLGLSLLNLLILVGLAAPRALAEPSLIVLVLGTCAGMTLLGMGLAVFFRSLAQFFFPLAAVGLLGAMPMYMVFTPSPALQWTEWLPTYHVLFGAEAIMFTGEQAVIHSALLFCCSFGLLAAGFCAAAVHNRLMREAH
jgi:hypothetical protein